MTVSKLEKLLQQTQLELDAVTKELAARAAEQGEALKTSSSYQKWRLATDETEQERDRLVLLADKLAADVEREKVDVARSALTNRKAELQKQTVALALRISEEGAKAAAVLMRLAEEATANAADVERLNRELAEDERLLSADHLARYRDPVPREDIEATVVDLWTFEMTGDLVGDPDLVRELSYERGVIPPAGGVGSRPVPVVRKRFRQVRYLEAGDRVHFEPLGSLLRLPRFDAPGMLFDRGKTTDVAPRRELLELIPAPDAAAKPATSEAVA